MSEIAFVTWDGGRNLAPALALARELAGRGDRVRLHGHAAQAASCAGLDFHPYETTRPFRSTDTVKPLALLSVLADRAMGQEVLAGLHARPADLVVVDCLLFGVMDALARAGRPYVVLEHSLDAFFRRAARGPLGQVLRLRGFPARRLIDSGQDVLVTALPELDAGHGRCTHVGPVVRGTPAAPSSPTVVISLSTVAYRPLVRTWQRVLDAVDGLPVPVVATLGPSLDPGRLRVPPNVEVHGWLPHDDLLPPHRAAAARLGERIRALDGGTAGADHLEALLART